MEIYDMESDLINEFDNFSNFITSETLKKGFTHTYIDGTVQEGKYINDEGKIVVGSEKIPNTELMRLIYDFYPKDKGFIERDDKGRYFYFEPLPDFKMNEIKRLEKLRDDAIKSEALKAEAQKRLDIQKQEAQKRLDIQKQEAQKKEAEAQKRLDIQKQEAQKKIDEDNKIALEKSKIENETKLKLTKTENDAKNKKIAIISISSLAVLFIGLKLFNKI